MCSTFVYHIYFPSTLRCATLHAMTVYFRLKDGQFYVLRLELACG